MKKKSLFLLTSIMLALTACKGGEVSNVTEPDTEVVADSDENLPDDEQDPGESEEPEETGGMFNTGNYYIDSMTIDLPDDRMIESHEWIDDDHRCYRVRIDYKEQPDNAYKHVEDFFYYIEDEESVVTLYVSYPDKDDTKAERYVYDACDFDAKLADVTFDGHDDIVISLGHAGSHGDEIYCAYVYDHGEFVYNRTYELIPNPEIDPDNKRILSSVTYRDEDLTEPYRYNSNLDYWIYDYSTVDKQGLDIDIISLFEMGAIYLEKPLSTENIDASALLSEEIGYYRDFLFMTPFEGIENLSEKEDFEPTPELCTQLRISYDDWAYAIKEVFGADPDKLRDLLGTEYNGEFDVFYNPDDDCIYMCAGAIGFGYESAKPRHVWKDGDTYVIMYDIYTDLYTDYPYTPLEQAYVTIQEADNTYGYRLISIE